MISEITASAPKGKGAELVAKALNGARDGVGNGALHVAATYGSCKCVGGSSTGQIVAHEARGGEKSLLVWLADLWNISDDTLDILLDQEGLEIDELDRMEKDTPLHKAVRYSNSLVGENKKAGHAVVDILVDAGCDPRHVNLTRVL